MITFHIIIVTHNSAATIGLCMEALLRQTYKDYLVTIVDSGSSDPSYLRPYGKDDRVTLIEAHENIGFCEGNNVGVQQGIGDSRYIIFLNPDVILLDDFLEEDTVRP